MRTIDRMPKEKRSSHTVLAYQATDLARHHREVIDVARAGRALVRDKDGTALILALAADIERNDEIAELALELARVRQMVEQPVDRRSPSGYGDLAWLSLLPDDDQRKFLKELTEALLVAASGTSLRPVELLIGDWRATAEAWADPDIRAALLAKETAPLTSVEL
jgi:hypothetical protein